MLGVEDIFVDASEVVLAVYEKFDIRVYASSEAIKVISNVEKE